jgi:hypothetical protein
VEIRESARKHGISDADIEHAVGTTSTPLLSRAPLWTAFSISAPTPRETSSKLPCLSPPTGTQIVVHAMKLRRKFEELLR